MPVAAQAQPQPAPAYVGSASCSVCHTATYNRWKNTRMANVVRDPKEHPDAIIPDLSQPNPLVTFTKDQIAWVYGSKWKQRYFTKVGDDYFPLGAQWDITHKQWRAYQVANGTDWWTEFYPGGNATRPTGPLCDGCHSVNYDLKAKKPTEWNVGCEKCHGPGGAHVDNPAARNIVNPARLDSLAGVDVCVQCHSQGKPVTRPIDGVYYDWAVGYRPGLKLHDFWELEEHKLGETTFTHFAGRHGAQEPDAGERLRAERDVHARRHLLQLPRRPRDGQQRGPHQAAAGDVPDVPRSAVPERSAHRDAPAAHAPPAELHRQPVHRLPHAADRDAAGRRQRAEPHVQVHLARDDGFAEGAEPVHDLPHGQDHEVGARRAQVVARVLTLAGG